MMRALVEPASSPSNSPKAGDIAIPLPALTPDLTCSNVWKWFHEHPGVIAAAVVDAECNPIGLVNRATFFAQYSRPYVPELFGRKSILKLADANPLVIEDSMEIGELSSHLLAERPDAIVECFVVVSDGKYRGIATGETLFRAKVQLLQSALSEAKDASYAKSSFLALMSHELRTPLNAIIGFSDLIKSLAFGNDLTRYQDYANDINNAGAHLLSLVNEILDLAKAEAGMFELHPEPVDVSVVMAECGRFMRDRAHKAGLSLQISSQTLPLFKLDRVRLKQVLLNLLSNAIKFTPAGGEVTSNARINGEGELELEVCDTGVGMEKDQIPVALTPFRQLSSPLSRQAEGTGLGLPLVKSLVELQGGRLRIESAIHVGTSVTVIFPAQLRSNPSTENKAA
jgi:two-component system, cell cycle sensor histidine kinase PleC